MLMGHAAWVHYGQIYVQSGDAYPGLAECFGGQVNGLCGAAEPGFLFLITGLHTGEVGFMVELYDAPPPLDDEWQEIVEASFQPSGEAALVSWAGQKHWPLDLAEASYRVRYCATRMDEGRRLDTRTDEDPEADRYLLQLWPAPPTADKVVKQTSEIAGYWHGFAREQRPPPTPAQKAAAEQQARAEQRRAAEQSSLEAEAQRWGDRPPSQRLRDLGGNALNVARLDRALADALGQADPVTQRKVARWATRRAFAEAQLSDIAWIAPALDAMDRGEQLPMPFDSDAGQAWNQLFSDERVPHTLVSSLDGAHTNILQQAMALPALFSARDQDPLRSALDALWHAAVTFGRERHLMLFSEIRLEFPELAGGSRALL